MAATPTAGGETFPSGWYGKIPATGDFIARRLPGAFCDTWGRWLHAALDGARERLGARWRDDFLSMPVWRYVLEGGLITRNAWAGVMAPSVDAVGRYFPLVLASPLPAARLDAQATLFAARSWFEKMEEVALSAIAPLADVAAVDAAIAAHPFRAGWLRCNAVAPDAPAPMACMELPRRSSAEHRAAWLAEASDIFGRTLLVCDELPPPGPFCAMMDGRWLEHGWVRREASLAG
jgi:type VI secretion system protein ImpM